MNTLPPTPAAFEVVLLGGDPALRQACATALGGLARIYLEADADRPHHPALVMLVLRPPFTADVEVFCKQRRAQPDVPIMLLSAALRADVAVELVKHGAVDFLALPPDPAALQRKAERVLLCRPGVTLDAPALEPLRAMYEAEAEAAERARTQANRRRCFRAQVPSQQALVVRLPHLDGEVQLVAEDLSVPIDDQPGGMRLRADNACAPRLPAEGAEVAARFHLPGEAAPLPGSLRVMRATSGPAHVWLGVEYRLSSTRDEEKIQRLWVQYQRQVSSGGKKK